MKAGDTVIYQGKETHIEVLFGDGTCNIANPFSNWDEEAVCVESGEEYEVPYWITVDLNDLSSPCAESHI